MEAGDLEPQLTGPPGSVKHIQRVRGNLVI